METPESTTPPSELKTETGLLPAFLLSPGAFLWLWVLPVAVLLALNAQGYWLIEGNMNAAQRATAGWFGLACVGNLVAGVGAFFALGEWGRRKVECPAPLYYWGIGAVAVQVAYLWLALSQQSNLLPVSVTRWIYTEDRFVFNQFAFAMLPLFYGILILAGTWRVADTRRSLWVSLGFTIGAPVLCYVVVHALFWSAHFPAVMVATVLILLGLLMFLGLVRVLMMGLGALRRTGVAGDRWAIVVVALVFPIGGLLLNRSISFPVDFQAWEVYALVVANTAILFFASWKQSSRPFLSFSLLCATLPFSLYFFIVFLPYTPLSILAVIAAGLGFLVLAPTLLFVLHLSLLTQVLRGPLALRRTRSTALVGVLCFLLLPAFFTLSGLADKAALNAALDYVYSPSVKSGRIDYPSSIVNLRRALSSHRDYKNGIYYPLLSDFYSWLVFDNLVLPDNKLIRLETMFFGTAGSAGNGDPVRQRNGVFTRRQSVRGRSLKPRANPMPQTVEVKSVDVRTLPAGEANTVVTLALTLRNTGFANAEYVKLLTLPAGVYISGLRLQMNGTPVPGRIFERKTALWIYEIIRDSERRDPALLAYTAPGQVELRVFPVTLMEPSIVEVDILVPAAAWQLAHLVGSADPAEILAALGQRIPLQQMSDAGQTTIVGCLNGEIAASESAVPYLHLIIDRSLDNGFEGDLSTVLRGLKEKFPTARCARVTVANYAVVDAVTTLTPLDELTRRPMDLESILPLRGGLALDLALAHSIRMHRDLDLDHASLSDAVPLRPIFVVVSRNAVVRKEKLEVAERWADLLSRFELHEMTTHGGFMTQFDRSLGNVTWLRLGSSIRPFTGERLVRFPGNSSGTSLESWSAGSKMWHSVSGIQLQPESSAWSRAVKLEKLEQNYARSPGDAGNELRDVVAESRASGILLPETSYIAVENSAQWRALEAAEKTKLGKNSALEFVETPAPPAVYVAGGFVLWVLFRRSRST